MMAPKLRFSRGLKAKAPGPVTACVPGLLRRRSSKFLQARRPRQAQEATMGKVTIFFFFTFEGLSSVWLLFTNVLTQALLLGISPDSWLAMFHSQRCSYIRTDDPSTKAMARRAFTMSWNVDVFVHSRIVVIFPQAPPSLVSSPSKYPPSFAALAFNKTKPALSSIAVVTKASKRTARTSLSHLDLETSTTPVSCQLDKNRAKHRRTVFSMKKGPEEQAAINELTKKTPRKHATTTTVGGRALTNA